MQSNEILGSLFLILIAAISVFYYLRLLKIIFFESKEVSSTNLQVQTIFHSYFFDLDCLVLVLFLFFLIFFFFYPTFLLLICQYFVLNFFSF
jgi:NADH:ubiquinone oxidoreductase subunit 2 (subunit N)